MKTLAARLGIVALAAFALVYGCGQDANRPAGLDSPRMTLSLLQIDCGEVGYLSQLSPQLPLWKDSIEVFLGDTIQLDLPPLWNEQSTAKGYLAELVPVLQLWETDINGAFASPLLGTVPDFNPGDSRSDYLAGLSSLLVAWKDSLEAERGTPFLPDPPVFEADTVAPVIVCPADTIISCADPEGVVVEFEATATDDCDPSPVITSDVESGSVFPVGTTEVTYTSVDFSGNESSCTFNVTVATDTLAPVVSELTASPDVLWPPNHKWVDVEISLTAVDDCDPAPTYTIVEVTCSEPVNGKGDGNTEPDWKIADDRMLKLRAERSGNGDGRIYYVRVRCEDSTGNAVEHTVEVAVPHDSRPDDSN